MHDSILAGNIWQERGTYDVRLNPTLTGSVTYADITHASSIVGGGGSQTLGRGVLSSEGVQNRLGYAGYRYDHHLAGAGRHLYHVRHRVYQAHIGRWATRDPLGDIDGPNRYQYVRSMPLIATDPWGLDTAITVGGGCFSGACGGATGERASVAGFLPPVDWPLYYKCVADCKSIYAGNQLAGCTSGCMCAAMGQRDCAECCDKDIIPDTKTCELSCNVYKKGC
jgi:RHS repeat-associated protein